MGKSPRHRTNTQLNRQLARIEAQSDGANKLSMIDEIGEMSPKVSNKKAFELPPVNQRFASPPAKNFDGLHHIMRSNIDSHR